MTLRNSLKKVWNVQVWFSMRNHRKHAFFSDAFKKIKNYFFLNIIFFIFELIAFQSSNSWVKWMLISKVMSILKIVEETMLFSSVFWVSWDNIWHILSSLFASAQNFLKKMQKKLSKKNHFEKKNFKKTARLSRSKIYDVYSALSLSPNRIFFRKNMRLQKTVILISILIFSIFWPPPLRLPLFMASLRVVVGEVKKSKKSI
jgi:hypothetical protein